MEQLRNITTMRYHTEDHFMKCIKWLMVTLASVGVLTYATPSLAQDSGIRLDVGGKVATNTAENIGMGWGGALSYMFPDSPFSVGIGAQWYGMNNGFSGSVVDMPLQVAYHMSNTYSNNLDPYIYAGNDVRFVSAQFGGASVNQTHALNPTFGIGARWFFTPMFGIHATIGGRVDIDNNSTPQFVSNIGTSFRF